ncbi:MAG: DUF1349 domain-containing protein [Pseudomonadota bacterium]
MTVAPLAVDGIGVSCASSNAFLQQEATGDGRVRLVAAGDTDWFIDPDGRYARASAPVAWFSAPTGDFAFGATVEANLATTFDAAGLMVRDREDWWAKLAYERSPAGSPTIVSVISAPVSDDANGPEVFGGRVQLRVVRTGAAIAMHWRSEGTRWHLVRYASMPERSPIEVGLLVQSPQGQGCDACFSSGFLSQAVPQDIRSGE